MMLMIGGAPAASSRTSLMDNAAPASDTDRAAIRARFAAGDVDAILQPPGDLPFAEGAAGVLPADLGPAVPEAGGDMRRRAQLDRALPLLVPLPARRIEARLRVHAVIDLI